MIDRDAAERDALKARLAQSREELSQLFRPQQDADAGGNGAWSGNGHSDFPRSRTMQLIMSGRGLGTLAALAGGLLMARPRLALRLLRMVPAGTVAKMLMARVTAALKAHAAPEGGRRTPE